MSFPRAAIKRFNEPADTTIPPPGTYTPKFATDVAVSSALKGIVFEKWSRSNSNSKARTEDNEPSQSGRLSRNSSFTRKSSTIVVPSEERKRGSFESSQNTPVNTGTVRHASVTNSSTRKIPSCTSSSSCKSKGNPEVKAKLGEKNSKQDQQKSRHDVDEDAASSHIVMARIQEIQDMAENLQVEVSEYKRRLTNELIRNQEMEAKLLELEFTNKSLRREISKYESAKDAWEQGQTSQQTKLEELHTRQGELELEISKLQGKCEMYKDGESNLLQRITRLEEEKLRWQEEKVAYEKSLKTLDIILQEEKTKVAQSDLKCNEMLAQMDTCYHVCESRTADAENMKELLEVKVQELTQEKEDLLKKLDTMKRELETEKTFTELVKSEQNQNQDKHNNYIS